MKLRLSLRTILPLLVTGGTMIGCERDCAKSERCQLQPEGGPCYSLAIKYYYNQSEKRCKSFNYGGCLGVVPFETLAQCQECECRE